MNFKKAIKSYKVFEGAKVMISKIYLFIFLFLNSFVYEAYGQNCKTLNEIKWPKELLHFYFSQSGVKIIPLPGSFCNIAKDIKVQSLDGREVGTFKIKNNVKEYYNDISLNSKSTSMLLPLYHKTIKQFSNPYVFTDFIFGIYNTRLLDEKNNKIQFLQGELINAQSKLDWNPYLFANLHWNAKNIDYKQLIQFYNKANVDFYSFADQDGFFFPKAVVPNDFLPKENKFNLMDLIFEYNPQAPAQNNEVVIFSTYKNTLRAYNLISKLFTKNARKVYWFNDAEVKWVDPKYKKNVQEIFKRTKIATADQFIASLKSNSQSFKIIDISDPDVYDLVHFKNSISLKPKKLTPEEFKNYYLKNNTLEAYNGLLRKNKVTGNYMLEGLDKLSKSNKFYLVGHHMLDPLKSNNVYKTLMRLGYTDVLLVVEPVSELLNILSLANLDPDKYIFHRSTDARSVGNFLQFK